MRHLVPLTRNSFSPDDESEHPPRVRLHQRKRSEYYDDRVPLYGSDKPFYLDPLPQPYTEMVSPPKSRHSKPCLPEEKSVRHIYAGR